MPMSGEVLAMPRSLFDFGSHMIDPLSLPRTSEAISNEVKSLDSAEMIRQLNNDKKPLNI